MPSVTPLRDVAWPKLTPAVACCARLRASAFQPGPGQASPAQHDGRLQHRPHRPGHRLRLAVTRPPRTLAQALARPPCRSSSSRRTILTADADPPLAQIGSERDDTQASGRSTGGPTGGPDGCWRWMLRKIAWLHLMLGTAASVDPLHALDFSRPEAEGRMAWQRRGGQHRGYSAELVRGLARISLRDSDRQQRAGAALRTRGAFGGMPVLLGEEQAAPGVGEEALVTLRAPATLAGQQLIQLDGVGGPHDVGGLLGVQAQRGDGGEVGDEAAHVRCAALGDLVPWRGQFRLGARGLLDYPEHERQAGAIVRTARSEE